MEFEFGYHQNDNSSNTNSDNTNDENVQPTNIDTGGIEHEVNGVPADNVNETDVTQNDSDSTVANDTKNNLVSGTSIEVGDETYTVDDNGNVIDKNGNVFKEASEVQKWLEGFDNIDETIDGDISINAIQEAIGMNFVDDNNNPIEFENSIEGITNYVNNVIESSRDEHYEAAINTLYQRYPIIEDVLNYYIANGNSLDGYGDVPDRSNIVVDENNESQQEAIIRLSWQEQGRKGDVDNYLNYLKTSNSLYSAAVEELENIQAQDAAYKEELAQQAAAIEEQEMKEMQNYWSNIYDTINSRKLAGYTIPESIIINRNGNTYSVTPDDFFNYIYMVDENGKSAYAYDLEKEDIQSRQEDELLRAYLKFVGGNYSNLVDVAINEDKVNKLKLRSKERNSSTIRINKPKANINKGTNIDLGYN